MRVAVLSDVHGNPAALEAALRDVEREQPDAIVFGGDLASGPFPNETLALLMPLERASYIRGNGDRALVTAFDHGRQFDASEPDMSTKATAWAASQLSREERDFLAGFQETIVLDVDGLGETLFCHGSPRSDEEIMTLLTPAERLRELVADTDQGIVVCGHTHMQFDRTVDETRILNAGSVGMPYQGEPSAFWLLLGPDVGFRRSEYDVDAFAARVAASGFPDDELAPLLRHPPGAEETAAFFEGIGPEPVVARD